jgi:epoxyqueuosine reductase QueG
MIKGYNDSKCFRRKDMIMAIKKNKVKINTEVQAALLKLDVDMAGVARMANLKDKKLKEAAVELLPSVNSIVVVGMEIWPEFLDLTSPEMEAGAPNLNDIYQQHMDYVRGKLGKAVYDVAHASRKAGLKALPLTAAGPAVDRRTLQAVISYKHAAEAAGLGRIGMSSLLVTPEYGPRVRLAICLTEAVLEPKAVILEQICRYCNVCVVKCPAHALERPKNGETYVINKFACRTYGDAAGGCSECMRVCPIASPRYD